MTRIVTTHYRYKRPPRKRKPVAIQVPAVVRRRAAKPEAKSVEAPDRLLEPPANDDCKQAIVTARRPGARDVPDLTPEEHRRRGEAADALFREVTGKARP